MAKGLVVSLNGEESAFGIVKVDREKLYGRKERIIVDDAGQPCSSALLTSDGNALIPAGGTAMLYVNPNFDSIERAGLRAVDSDGRPLKTIPSTLGVAQPLTGPVSPTRVLDHVVRAVYELRADTLGPSLSRALAAGNVFETRFQYRDDYEDSALFLVQNDQATFALVADPQDFEFLSRQTTTDVVAEDAGGGDDELDFGMM